MRPWGARGCSALKLGAMDGKKEKDLEDRLREVGSRLESPPSDVDELLPLLEQTESLLSRVEQSPTISMSNALKPAMTALVSKVLMGHSDIDVIVAVASCFNEITRITAPEAPYNDDLMKELFKKIVQAFQNLDDMSSRSFPKRISILETVAKVRSCVVMLDLECDSLILEMFQHFLKTIRPNHSERIFSSMETIMTLVLDESEDISSELILCLLDSVKCDNKDVLPVVRRLGEKVITNCAVKLKPYLIELSQSTGTSLGEFGEVVTSLCQENSGGTEQKDTIASNEKMESVKTEQQANCPEDLATEKPLTSVVSNGAVKLGNGESSVEPSSPEQKPEASSVDDQSDRATPASRDVSGGGQLEKEETSGKNELVPPTSDIGAVKDSSPAQKDTLDTSRSKRGRPSSKLVAERRCRVISVDSASSLQQKGSEMCDKPLPSKDADTKNEFDGSHDSGQIEKPSTRETEEKPQRQKGRKGLSNKIDHGDSVRKSRSSKLKEQDGHAAKHTAAEPILKISETQTPDKDHEDGLVGSRIRVWWPMDKKFYDGVVDSYDQSSKKHKIVYSDGDVEVLLLKKERWEFAKDDAQIDMEQPKDTSNTDATEEPKRKRAKTSSSSLTKERNTGTPVAGATALSSNRKGRPPKVAVLNLDETPSSSNKLKEKAASKSKEDNSTPGSKLKKDEVSSKGDVSKSNMSSSKSGSDVKNIASKSSRKSFEGSTKSASKLKDNSVNTVGKAKKETLKSKSRENNVAQKDQGTTTPKSGSEPMPNVSSEKGKTKVPESETLAKLRSNSTPKASETEASTVKKRKRKGQT